MRSETTLPEDVYSQTWARLIDNPAAITAKGTTIDLTTMLGHTETWVIRTIRVGLSETIFLQRVNAEGGTRFLLPAAVASAINRQREAIAAVARKRAARQAAATRKAKA